MLGRSRRQCAAVLGHTTSLPSAILPELDRCIGEGPPPRLKASIKSKRTVALPHNAMRMLGSRCRVSRIGMVRPTFSRNRQRRCPIAPITPKHIPPETLHAGTERLPPGRQDTPRVTPSASSVDPRRRVIRSSMFLFRSQPLILVSLPPCTAEASGMHVFGAFVRRIAGAAHWALCRKAFLAAMYSPLLHAPFISSACPDGTKIPGEPKESIARSKHLHSHKAPSWACALGSIPPCPRGMA